MFFFTEPAPTQIYTLSLHDALPISSVSFCSASSNVDCRESRSACHCASWSRSCASALESPESSTCNDSSRPVADAYSSSRRSEEHTSELQSQFHLVCRLLLEKKN